MRERGEVTTMNHVSVRWLAPVIGPSWKRPRSKIADGSESRADLQVRGFFPIAAPTPSSQQSSVNQSATGVARAMAHTKPASSRVTATHTLFRCGPRTLSR